MLGTLFSGGSVSPSAQVPLSFRISAERSLRLSSEDGYDALSTWHHLSHHIRRYPHDLRAHVQRILLAKDDELDGRLEGSLLDLFLALGNAGDMLKERVLDACAADIDAETGQLLRGMLENGLAADQSTPWRNGSVLATGDSARSHQLLTVDKTESPQSYDSLLAEIQDCLEYGQLDVAQELLETEILAGRATPELEQELLIIYQHTRNKTGLEKCAGALHASGAVLSDDWVNALNEALNW